MSEQTATNKQAVREFYDLAFNQKRPEEAVAKYVGPSTGSTSRWPRMDPRPSFSW